MHDLSRRIHDEELMDDLARPESEFIEAYRELAIINRYLGGIRAIERFSPAIDGGFLLDVAAGACDIGDALTRQSRWRVVGLALNAGGLRMARHSLAVVGDAFELPFSDDAFDVVTASLFFHHLSDDDCVRVLGSMYRVARRMIIVNDLHRHQLAYLSIVVLTRLFSRSVMVRNDGPLSVRRAFRVDELARIARRAGIDARVYRSFPYRLVLVAEK